MLCYKLWLFVKRLSHEAIQRRSQRDRLVKIKVFKLRRDADDILCNFTLRSAGEESFHSAGLDPRAAGRKKMRLSRRKNCRQQSRKNAQNARLNVPLPGNVN